MVKDRTKKEGKIIFLSLVTVITTILVVIYSEASFNAALEGLQVWWEVVFPALLPFFIIAELLMGLGVVHFLGTLLEPLMRPLFKVPGVGAFAMAMGLASGYPIGAKITSNLRREKLCTKTEAERLISFTNTADPLFMVGAVAVGMFHRPELGMIIAGAHYLSCILVGLVMRFYKGEENDTEFPAKTPQTEDKNIFVKAYNKLISARRKDGRPFGKLLGDSIMEAINTLLLIGGFIILFSVVTRIISVSGIINHLTGILTYFLSTIGLSRATVLPLISGFFEITNGANLASQIRAPLLEQLIVVNIIIAWSGLSVHAQVATMVNGTDIKLKPYLFARVLQGVLAGICTLFFFIPFDAAQPVSLPLVKEIAGIRNFLLSILGILITIIVLSLIISISIHYLRKMKIVVFNLKN